MEWSQHLPCEDTGESPVLVVFSISRGLPCSRNGGLGLGQLSSEEVAEACELSLSFAVTSWSGTASIGGVSWLVVEISVIQGLKVRSRADFNRS